MSITLTAEQAQQIEEALESCKTVIKDLIDDKYKSKAIVLKFADKALTNIRAARAQEQAEQTQPDSFCQESDGCPTELAVLQRFWREKQAEQEPVAYLTEQQALEKLCNYINQNFKTQREAAKSFEISDAYLSAVLNGKKRITEAMAHRLSLTRQRCFWNLLHT